MKKLFPAVFPLGRQEFFKRFKIIFEEKKNLVKLE